MRRLLWTLLALVAIVLFVLMTQHDSTGAGRIDLSSLTVKIAVAALLGALTLVLLRQQLSRAIEQALIWPVIVLLLVVGYAYRIELRDVSGRVTAELLTGHAAARGRVVEITRGAANNFALTAHINGASVAMVLDSGASSVVLTQKAAKAAGLPVEVLTYTVKIETANGLARAAPVTLDSLAVGGIVERAVPALIAQPGHLHSNLLGMSFLNRLERWEVSDDKLVLRSYP